MKRLRILIVGHCHPELPHVCALRTRGFAEALGQRGHDVVLLTSALPGAAAMPPADAVGGTLAGRFSAPRGPGLQDAQDPQAPLVLGCPPRGHGWARRARHGQFPPVLNKAVLTGSFLAHSGLFADWVDGSRPYWPVLADRWRPDIVWATFGNTGAWRIAQGIAGRARCPWIMDLKDPWADFTPAPLRRLLAARFADAAGATALADTHGADLRRWFGQDAVTVPSGVDIPGPETAGAAPDGDAFRISLVGSLYGDDDLRTFLAGVRAWAAGRRAGTSRPVRPAILDYFGAEADRLKAAATDLHGVCEVRTHGFVPAADLALRLRASHINAFVNIPSGFRHKVLEFAVAGRPIMCVPMAGVDESGIVRQAGGTIHSCSTVAGIKGVLDDMDRHDVPGRTAVDVESFSWNARAAQIERVFGQVLEQVPA